MEDGVGSIMEAFKGLNDVLYILFYLILRQFFIEKQLIMQGASGGELQEEGNLVVLADGLVELDDFGVFY